MNLYLIFGLVLSSVNILYNFGLSILFLTVRRIKVARIKGPTLEEMRQSCSWLMNNREAGYLLKYSQLYMLFLFLVQHTIIWINKKPIPGGFTCSVEITKLVVFNFKDELIYTRINYLYS